jgi:IS1 family transposase
VNWMNWRLLWAPKNKIWLWTAVDHFHKGILGWVLGDHSAETFRPLWAVVSAWQCYFYITDGWTVYPGFIPDGDQIVSKTYMTRVEGENTRTPLAERSSMRHYLARLHRKTLCYFKSVEMLKHSIRRATPRQRRMLLHYLKFDDIPVPSRFIS